MRSTSGMGVMYSPSSSTQESGLASVRASSQRERKAEDRQEIDKKSRSRYWTIRRCYVLSPVLLLLPLRSALSASSLWNKIYLLLLSLGFVTGAKEEESENVCCLVVEKASKHRREANGQYNIIFFCSCNTVFLWRLSFFLVPIRSGHSVLLNSNISQLSINVETDNKQRFRLEVHPKKQRLNLLKCCAGRVTCAKIIIWRPPRGESKSSNWSEISCESAGLDCH